MNESERRRAASEVHGAAEVYYPMAGRNPSVWKMEGPSSPSCIKNPAPYEAGMRRGTNNDL